MDVKIGFLNRNLAKKVYMDQPEGFEHAKFPNKDQPEGFEHAKFPNKALKLEKSICGLKQASHSWNLCFHEKVKEFRFSRSEDKSFMYIKASCHVVIFLVLYVHNILLIENDIPKLHKLSLRLGYVALLRIWEMLLIF